MTEKWTTGQIEAFERDGFLVEEGFIDAEARSTPAIDESVT